jgi:hypothetical protein
MEVVLWVLVHIAVFTLSFMFFYWIFDKIGW